MTPVFRRHAASGSLSGLPLRDPRETVAANARLSLQSAVLGICPTGVPAALPGRQSSPSTPRELARPWTAWLRLTSSAESRRHRSLHERTHFCIGAGKSARCALQELSPVPVLARVKRAPCASPLLPRLRVVSQEELLLPWKRSFGAERGSRTQSRPNQL